MRIPPIHENGRGRRARYKTHDMPAYNSIRPHGRAERVSQSAQSPSLGIGMRHPQFNVIHRI